MLTSTFKSWYRWIRYVNPCFWGMGIMYVNECKDNSPIFGIFYTYDTLADGYGWNMPIRYQFACLVAVILCEKFAAYLCLRLFITAKA